MFYVAQLNTGRWYVLPFARTKLLLPRKWDGAWETRRQANEICALANQWAKEEIAKQS